MGIHVHLENESGDSLQALLDPTMLLPHLLKQFDLSGTTCLRFIDSYGDTVFNHMQIPVLINELAEPRPKLDARSRKFIDGIIECGERAQAERHLYLKFEGD